MNIVKKVLLDIPVNEQGDYDLVRQKQIANNRWKIYLDKEQIIDSLKELLRITVAV